MLIYRTSNTIKFMCVSLDATADFMCSIMRDLSFSIHIDGKAGMINTRDGPHWWPPKGPLLKEHGALSGCTGDCGGNTLCYGRGYQSPCYHSRPPSPGYSGTRGHGGAIFRYLCRAASPSMEKEIQRRQAAPGYWKQQTSTVYNS